MPPKPRVSDIQTAIREEYRKCALDPVYFFRRYSIIEHPTRGRIPFEFFPFQEDAFKQFQQFRYNIILKSRQMGISTLVAGYALYCMLFKESFKVLVVAVTQDVAKNIVTKVKVMHDNLPIFLRGKVVDDNKLELSFTNGSSIKAVSSSPSATRSHGLSLLIIDEFAFVDRSDEVWAAAQMTLSTGGNAIVLSTPNGMGNQFHKLYISAVEGKRPEGLEAFNPINLPWHLHPERDQKWRDLQTELLGPRLASQECDCIDGSCIVTVRNKITGKVKQTTLHDLYTEMENLLVCKICGYTAKQLHQHLKSVHNMNSVEYRLVYGQLEQMQYNFNPNIIEIDPKLSEITKGSYRRLKESIDAIDEIIPLDEVKKILLEDNLYINYIGRTKHRTLICENLQLYKSILCHSDILQYYFSKISFPNRIKFILDYDCDVDRLKCECRSKYTFGSYCRKCRPSFPSEKWFLWKYGKEAYRNERIISKLQRKFQSAGRLSLEWFKRNYSDEEYLARYEQHYQSVFNDRCVRYSKISQELFREIEKFIPEIEYYAEKSGEYKIFLTRTEREYAGQIMYCLDLFYRNKNIEFDGEYFIKSEDYIHHRDNIMKSRGIRVLRVSESEFRNNKDETIKKCVEFLND